MEDNQTGPKTLRDLEDDTGFVSAESLKTNAALWYARYELDDGKADPMTNKARETVKAWIMYFHNLTADEINEAKKILQEV